MDAKERLTVAEATAPTQLGAMHVHRYEVAAALCRDLRVADVGCGSGYGSSILARASSAVLGVDIDRTTIELAERDFGDADRLRFEVRDAHEFLRDNLGESIDAVVMLETIEHLANPEEALVSLRRHAEDGLRVVVSLPNSRMLEEDNPFHVTDFGYDEVIKAFEGFPSARTLFQFVAEGSLIRDGNASRGHDLELTDGGEEEYANQFLVLVNVPDDALAGVSALMRLYAEPVHHRYVRNLERANAELRAVNAKLSTGRLGKSDSAAAALVARNRALEEEARSQSAAEHREWIDGLHRQIEENRKTIEAMESSRAWRLAERYRRVRRSVFGPRTS